jgi:transcriptional regulator with XRE-family HTH domain
MSDLFPALLKYWRGRRGLSQLDLALGADVSSRHVSFLETGRAKPSREMVLRLGSALEVPLRDQNALLHAAGFAEIFEEPPLESGMSRAIQGALDHMLESHEPFPMVVMNRHYDVERMNRSAAMLLGAMVLEPSGLTPPVNAFRILFDPRLIRPFIVDWESVAHALLARLHREALHRAHDRGLSDLLRALMEYPDVPESWRQPDLAQADEPVFTVRLERDELKLAFLTTLTMFSAPRNITLDELRIESYFPLDDETRQACRRLAG